MFSMNRINQKTMVPSSLIGGVRKQVNKEEEELRKKQGAETADLFPLSKVPLENISANQAENIQNRPRGDDSGMESTTKTDAGRSSDKK